MCLKPYLITVMILIACVVNTQAINIKVRVLSESNIRSVNFSVVAVQYMLLCDNSKPTEEDIKAGESLTLSYYDGKIRVEKGVELLGTFSQVDLIGTRYNNVFSLFSSQVGRKRSYEERLSISVSKGFLLLVNRVDLEK